MVHRIHLVHWNKNEASDKAERICVLGYEVDHAPFDNPATLRQLRENPPTAIVIDLTRLPSHGRDVALAIREYKDTRHVPLVFVEGEAEKVEKIKKLLPDAVYTSWSEIKASLEDAIANPPAKPVVPRSRLEEYSGTPLQRNRV